MFDEPQQLEVFPTTVDLKRIDPSLNMRRFYRMSVQPDLFGGACLVRESGYSDYLPSRQAAANSCTWETRSSHRSPACSQRTAQGARL